MESAETEVPQYFMGSAFFGKLDNKSTTGFGIARSALIFAEVSFSSAALGSLPNHSRWQVS